jgi:hypothetical protein
MRRLIVRKALVLTAGWLLLVVGTAAAQQAKGPTKTDLLLTYFYQDPRPERLVGFFESYGAEAPNWNSYPPLVGFFAVVLRTHPDWIEKLTPTRPNGKVADTIAAALRLSGQEVRSQGLRARLAQAGSDPTLQAELANLPAGVEDLQITSATHLDILWGASFASGDGRHARKIIDFFAQTANRSEQLAYDAARTAVAMSGGPKEVYGELRGKYGDALGREIVFAGTALWALASNARRHQFVNEAITTYIRENPTTYATKPLEALRPKGQTL